MGRHLGFSNLEYKEHCKKHLCALYIQHLFHPCPLPDASSPSQQSGHVAGTSPAAALLYLAVTFGLAIDTSCSMNLTSHP